MSVLAIGMSHHTAPVALLERVTVSGDALVKLLHDLRRDQHVSEVLLVSTCNRVEVYADVDRFHGGLTAVTDLLSVHSGIPQEQLTRHLYVHYEDRAVQHFFSVACGLDSMVVGEGQILGQIRAALRLAQNEGTAGSVLNDLTQQALRVGKRAHADTDIDRAGASLIGVGLSLAEQVLGPVAGMRALVVGAGSMSALAAATLRRTGVTDIVIANRTFERGVRLAEAVGGRAVRLADIQAELAGADLVISCVGSGSRTITVDMMSAAVAGREAAAGAAGGTATEPDIEPDTEFSGDLSGDLATGRAAGLFLLDLALPHDVDPGVRTLPGVTLVDLESMQQAGVGADDGGRGEAISAVKEIVTQEVTAYLEAERSAKVTPTVIALRSMAADVVEAEIGRLFSRTPELDGRLREEVSQTIRRVVDKLLHEPTVRVKRLAASPAGDHYAEALRELFNLDPQAPDAVSRMEVES